MANHRRTLRVSPASAPQILNVILIGQVQALQSFCLPVILGFLSGQWSHLEIFPEVQHVHGNTFVFIFQTEEDSRTVENGTWNVSGHLLVLRRWDEMSCLRELRFDFATFWIQLHDLPGFCYSDEIVWQIAAVAGQVQELDLRDFSYARVRVLVNIEAPLTAGVIVERPGRLTDSWVYFKFERLENFCHHCGRIDHSTPDCMHDVAPAIEVRGVDGTLQPYGPWLRAEDRSPPLWDFPSPSLHDADEEEEQEEDEQEVAMDNAASSDSGHLHATSQISSLSFSPIPLDNIVTAAGDVDAVLNCVHHADCNCATSYANLFGVEEYCYFYPNEGISIPENLGLSDSPPNIDHLLVPYPEGLTFVETHGEYITTSDAGSNQ